MMRGMPLPDAMVEAFSGVLVPFLMFAVPISIMLIATQAAYGGIHFVMGNASLKLNKINPGPGLTRMVGTQALMEAFKSILKITLVGGVGVFYIVDQLPLILNITQISFEAALVATGSLIIKTFIVLVAGAGVVAFVDAFYQWRRYKNQMMMTKQEAKDEHKQSEGSPEVRAKIRQMQRESAERGSVVNLSEAQVVVTNPTHFAVALRYDFEDGTAPKVVAKGSDMVAEQIRDKARELDLPVLSYPLLARALYFTSAIGQEIHTELYRAVATVLSYVFQAGTEAPQPEIEVPESMQFDTTGRKLEGRNV
jgi:flagellar biosynthetic protein FlhB